MTGKEAEGWAEANILSALPMSSQSLRIAGPRTTR